ncbi:MAG: hypothetical protein V4660_17770 [Pseudomonadota bacterium]
MNISRFFQGALTLALASTSIGAFATTSDAAIYNPSANFLNRKAFFVDAVSAAQANRLYYKKVLVDSGYVVPTNPTDQASVDAAIASFKLSDWKQKNGFNATGAVTAGAKYYNGVDLGLGRNMHCVNQDGNAVANRLKGMACYVSSHGKIGGTMREGLAAVNAANNQSFAAVAMEYRPTEPENKVRFFVFGEGGDDGTILYPQGNTTDNAFYQFDTGRGLPMPGQNAPGQPVPGVCLACHGGTLDAATGTISNAHFLPFDTFSLDFVDQTDRNKATLQFNKLNAWVYRAELLANPYPAPGTTQPTSQHQIIDFLKGSYLPAPGTAAGSEIAATAVMNDNYVDARFTPANSSAEDLSAYVSAYKSVVRPYCRGCHMAQTIALTPSRLSSACDPSNSMPHSETAHHNLYRHGDFVQPVLNRLPLIKNTTNCKSIFKLTDFEGLYPARSGFFRYNPISVNPVLVPGTTTALVNNKISKRTLRLTKGTWLPWHFSASEQSYNPIQGLKNASFEYALPTSSDTIHGTELLTSTSIKPSVPGSPFKVMSSVFDILTPAFETGMTSNRSILTGDQLAEVDNIMSEWNLNLSADIKQADFEDKTYGALGAPTLSIGSANSECFNKRTNDRISTNAFDISQRIKLSDDSGRYALSTNGTLCTNEVAKISFKLTGVPATGKRSSLSFNYETFGGSDGKGIAQLSYTTPTGLVTKNLHELTQETLDSNFGAAGGNVRIEIPVDSTFSISFKPSSGTALLPNKGLAIDNINVVTFTR